MTAKTLGTTANRQARLLDTSTQLGGAQNTVLRPDFYLSPNTVIGYITMFSAFTNS